MAKKISKKAEAAKVEAPVVETTAVEAKIEAAPVAKVRVAWNAGKVVVHHGVRIGEKSFPSTWKAFEGTPELATLSRGAHIRFRKNLKAAPGGKLDFVHPVSKKVYPFELIAE